MKTGLITILLAILSISSFAQADFEEWEKQSKTDKKLLPRYGHQPKSQKEQEADSVYIQRIIALPEFKTRRAASDHLIKLGFQYYYRADLKTAMYRFNQAYLLDSSNTDIFWGFGAVYMALGQPDLARLQYETGLGIHPGNTHLLTDLATFFMQKFYDHLSMQSNEAAGKPEEQARLYIDSALLYLKKSYTLDPKNVHTAYKMSVCYWNIHDCANAWKYYEAAMALGGAPVTEEYASDLKKRCAKK